MNARPQPPTGWSFAEPPRRQATDRSREVWIGVAAAVVVAAAALVAWLIWPTPPAQAPPPNPVARPLLSNQPPTVILNALDYRSLYPPGYVDFDSSRSDLPGPEELGIDMASQYTTSSQPPGCTDDPMSEAQYGFETQDPERYQRYPLTMMMYPVDDPGGIADDSGFHLSIFPSPDPESLEVFRDFYRRCLGAQITVTQTKDGRILRETTDTMRNVVTDAPPSNAVDSFGLTQGETGCGYVGLTRGMIVDVQCPTNQPDAGLSLFRNVIDRINAI